MESIETESWREGWRDVCSFESPERVALAAARELQAHGVTVPRRKSTTSASSSVDGLGCFGVGLEAEQERLSYLFGEWVFSLPRFFVEAVQVLEENVKCAGIFRKAGSVTRQKATKASLNAGAPLDTSNVHDVASLLKLYLRELPNPLLREDLTPVFEACHGREPREGGGQREKELVLIACLLLPKAHLECLRVLTSLLSSITSHEAKSLMDAGSLAVVMAPNLVRCDTEKLITLDNSNLRIHTGIVKTLIENARWIGLVPPTVAECARQLVGEIAESAVGGVEGCEGPAGEEGAGAWEVPGRFQRKKKYRTGSISGLVQSLSNHFKSMGGSGHPSPPLTPTASNSTPLPWGDPQEVGGASSNVTRHSRRLSFKRKAGSHEDLLGMSKRPALVPPSPSHRVARTPATGAKKRRNLLSRRRHTDQTKQHSSRLGRFALPNPFSKPQAVKLNFNSQMNGSSDNPKATDDNGKPVQLVGFTNPKSPWKPSSAKTGVSNENGMDLYSGVRGSLSADSLGPEPVPLPLHSSQRSSSIEVLTSTEGPDSGEGGGRVTTLRTGSTPRGTKAGPRRYSVIGGAGTLDKTHAYKSHLLAMDPSNPSRTISTSHAVMSDRITGQPLDPAPTYVARKSSSKRMRCDVVGGVSGDRASLDDAYLDSKMKAARFSRQGSVDVLPVGVKDATRGIDFSPTDRGSQKGYNFQWSTQAPAAFNFGTPSSIRASKSDHQIHMESVRPGKTVPSSESLHKFPSPSPHFLLPPLPSPAGRIPPSTSLPHFSLSHPRNRLGGGAEGGAGKGTMGDNGDTKTPVSRLRQSQSHFTFSNPRTLQRDKRSTSASGGGSEKPANTSVDDEFECSRKVSECNEANTLDEAQPRDIASSKHDNSIVSTALSSYAHFQERKTSNISLKVCKSATLIGGYEVDFRPSYSTPLGTHLDDAFLQTPHLPPPSSHASNLVSPNLLEKIQVEIASRHQFSPCTPSLLAEGSIKVNDSYREAVLGQDELLPVSLKFDCSLGGDTEKELANENPRVNPHDTELEIVPPKGSLEGGVVTIDPGVQESPEDVSRVPQDKSKTNGRHDLIQSGSPLRPSNVNSGHPNRQGNMTPEHKPPVVQVKHSPKFSKKPDKVHHISTPSYPHTPRGFVFSLPSPWSGRHRESVTNTTGEMKISKRAQVYLVPGPSSPKHSHKPPPGPPTLTPSLPPRPCPKGSKVLLHRRQYSLRAVNKENGDRGVAGATGEGLGGRRRVQVLQDPHPYYTLSRNALTF